MIVTGSGSGIGRVIAQHVAAEGAKVVVNDINETGAQTTAEAITGTGGTATVIAADVTHKAQVQNLIDTTLSTFGQIDTLINNAAIAVGNDIADTSEEVWNADVDVTMKSVYLCAQAVLPHMVTQKHGVILNIASVNGLAAFGNMAYSAAKAGVLNLTKNLAVNYGEHNIRVVAICPGTIRTPVWEKRLQIDPQIFERLSRWYPLGRVGEPEDIAKAAVFLVSDDASWITGTELTVDGGLTAGSYRMILELEARAPDQIGGDDDGSVC